MAIPFTLISGFLGSGKTTLLNRLLTEKHGIRFAVIVNEFGTIGLDAALLRGTQDFVEMSNGCLCCALNEDLVELLKKLKLRGGFDAVVLETTGIADPLPIAWAFLKNEMDGFFRFAGIVTVVDGLHLDSMLVVAPEARLQIERADYVYVSKTDLVANETLAQVNDEIKKINANARIVGSDDKDALALIFDFNEGAELTLKSPFEKSLHAQKPDYETLAFDLTGKKFSLAAFEDFFESLPQAVFRAKAIIDCDDGKTYCLHAVCGRVDTVIHAGENSPRAVVFIGRGMDINKLTCPV